MNSGSMRQFIEIQYKPRITTWGTTPGWTHFATCYSKIIFNNGTENNVEDMRKAKIRGTAKIRYNAGVTPQMRIKYGDRYFEILSVLDVNERKFEMLLDIEEVSK